ncbi:hypothetical protein WOLCODRAFT_156028 [Wolfiporia cocos MD-104 SS10]|uniref:Uncharacterized protein n=1 Tax=Wolfiporia cocos (strain MD-104) TaxID=742152 RepID=A0A2H3J0V6_WOLCO|nr:hypothetical protein WOLCODRAFT_156028 [Wolfiporia cocos MD-104 SS10]
MFALLVYPSYAYEVPVLPLGLQDEYMSYFVFSSAVVEPSYPILKFRPGLY